MKPIQTSYKGRLFRSRLEARWAVFLDRMGCSWEYELEGFDLGDAGWYLPDFWVRFNKEVRKPYPAGNPPEQGYWVEIKPVDLTDDERLKCSRLAQATGHHVYALCGSPAEYIVYKFSLHSGDAVTRDEGPKPWWCDWDSFLHYTMQFLSDMGIGAFDLPRVDRALKSATAARFEHGARP